MFYEIALEADPPLPLWGTCLGFEMLMYLAAEQNWPMDLCLANNKASPLTLKPGKLNK